MARPRTIPLPECGKRLLQVINEQGISQTELSRRAHISQQLISGICKGKKLTEATADAVLKVFPEYRKAWLMGFDDYKTKEEKASNIFKQSEDQETLLDDSVCGLVRLNGWKINSATKPAEVGIRNIFVFAGPHRERFILNDAEMEIFYDDVLKYVSFRLQQMDSIHAEYTADIKTRE